MPLPMRFRILEAATVLFAEQGYSFTLSDLVDRVGMKKPSIYNHFSGKDEIVEAIVAREIWNYGAAFDRTLQIHKFKQDRFECVYHDMVAYLRTPHVLSFWRQAVLVPVPAVRARYRQVLQNVERRSAVTIRDWYREGFADGRFQPADLDGLVMLYFSLIRGMTDSLDLLELEPDEACERAERAFYVFWKGLENPKPWKPMILPRQKIQPNYVQGGPAS